MALISLPPCMTESVVDFSRIPSFISSAPAMVRRAWSAGILVYSHTFNKGFHRVSSLDPGSVSDTNSEYLERVNIRDHWRP